MKRRLLFLVLLFCSTITLIGQTAKISVNPISQTIDIKSDSIKTFTVTINSTGNRDLNWYISRDSVNFSKADYADFTQAANQDRITNDVWITRKDVQGLFNIRKEEIYTHEFSPQGTKWSYYPVDEAVYSDYYSWEEIVPYYGVTSNVYGMHIENTDLYYDIQFHDWTSGGEGGGFSYTRYRAFPWLINSTDNGSIAPGESVQITVTIDARELVTGTHTGYLVIASNDPTTPSLQVPITLNVTGIAQTGATVSNLDFESKPITGNYSKRFNLVNPGTASYTVAYATQTTFFTVQNAPQTVEAGMQPSVEVVFSPTTKIEYFDTLDIRTSVDTIRIPLHGIGVDIPQIAANITSINDTLQVGDSKTIELVITNSGLYNLDWKVKASTDSVMFTKVDFAPMSIASNRDNITPSLSLARDVDGGLYNYISTNPSYAWGYSDELVPGDYTSFSTFRRQHENMNGLPASMMIPGYNFAIDFTFHSWTSNGQGGGFKYLREGAMYWLQPSANSFSTVPADKDTVNLVYNTNDMIAGEYTGEIIVTSNDPAIPTITIPTYLLVKGQPAISVNSHHDFGDVFLNATSTSEFEINNYGNDTLKISAINSLQGQTTVSPSSLNILPNEYATVTTSITPTLIGTWNDTLVIKSNDPNFPSDTIYWTANVVGPPSIVVDQTPIVVEIEADSIENLSVSIVDTSSSATNLEGRILLALSDKVSFVKADYQNIADTISSNVYLARSYEEGLYNAAVESSYQWTESPTNTLWHNGATSEQTDLGNYQYWRGAVYPPTSMVGNVVSMYSENDDAFYDFHFTHWTSGGSGGGFAYSRYEVPWWAKSVSNPNFSIASQDTFDFEYKIDASGLIAGVYTGKFIIESNDPTTGSVTIPFTLKVTGRAKINATSPLSFNNTPIGGSTSKTVTIDNPGSDTLKITNITKQTSVISISKTSLTVLPGKSAQISIMFAPTAEQNYLDTLTIISNAPDSTNYIVPIAGVGVQPPHMTVSLASLDTLLFSNQTAVYKVGIANTGLTALDWTLDGEQVNFVKVNNADFTLAANQDRIAADVWITRKSNQSIFNIARETGYGSNSPLGTLWATDLTANVSESDYQNFVTAVNANPQSAIGQNMSLWLPDYNRYFDVVFNSYTGGNAGGGFSYTRNEVLPNWISFSHNSGTIAAGSTDTVIVTLSSGTLTGEFMTNFALFSNDPALAQWPVAVNMQAGGIIVVNPLVDVTKNEGFLHDTVDFTNTFSYANTDVITYQIISSDTNIVKATLVNSTKIAILEKGVGSAFITIRAKNLANQVIYEDLVYKVNGAPVIADQIENFTVNENSGTAKFGLYQYFSDPNTDLLTFSVTSDSVESVAASIVGDTLLLTYAAKGDALITLTASDGLLQVTMQFTVLVNAVPVLANAIPDTVANIGSTLVLNLNTVFSDADADVLTFSATSSNETTATVSVSGSSLNINALEANTTVITLVASDGKGGSGTSSFNFLVNTIPTVANTLANVLVNEGSGIKNIDLSGVFNDADGNSLTITALSASTAVATVSVTGQTLSVTPIANGTSEITVSANDGKGGSISTSFMFEVNAIPTLENTISDVVVNEGADPIEIDLNQVFADDDADSLGFVYTIADSTIVSVSINDTILIVEALAIGQTDITIEANDGKGGTISTSFGFTVNAIPTVANAVADKTMTLGDAPLVVDIANVFDDADGDVLTLSVTSLSPSVATAALSSNNLTLTAVAEGSSIIELTATDGKGGSIKTSFSLTVNKGTGIADNQTQVNLYPNPTTGIINLTLDKTLDVLTFQLFDLKGQVVYTANDILNNGNYRMDLTDVVENGTYLLKVSSNNNILTTVRVVITK